MTIIQKHSDDYIRSVTEKDTIVLHYTGGGTLAGAEATLGIRDYVNVHFAIDLDGTVYQYIDEKYWAYHTGTGQRFDRKSIGIEIVNWGHLKREGEAYFTWTMKSIDKRDVYCLAKFRGFEYWERLRPKQEIALKALLDELKSRHKIKAVITHAMVKKTKLDFPPDYPFISKLTTGA